MRMFLVKREVLAKDIKEAMKKDGRIYEIQEAQYEPEEIKEVGFNEKKYAIQINKTT